MRIIAFDFDDVVCKITPAFLRFNKDYYGTHINYNDLNESIYEPLGITPEEEDKRWDLFFQNEKYAYPDLEPQILDFFLNLKEKHKLILVTARKRIWQYQLTNWLERYMKGVFEEVIFLDSPENQEKSKAQICEEHNCFLLIDDEPKNIDGCLKSKVKGILYNQPWNKNYKKDIMKINSILELGNIINNY